MSTTTQRVRVPLPPDFTEADRSQVESVVSKRLGGDFQLQSIDSKDGSGIFALNIETTTVVESEGIKGKQVLLAPTDCTANGERAAARIASDFPGYEIFKYEPHLSRAVIVEMDPDLKAARAAVASALGVKPWDVEMTHRKGGGYRILSLPQKYVPSKHDAALAEAATSKVPGGRPGWFVKINGQTLSGEIIPAELPTFPAIIPSPGRSKALDVNFSPFGIKLPKPGQTDFEEIGLDWASHHATLLAGSGGSGKRQPLYTRIPVPVSKKYPEGWATMGSIQPGETIYLMSGRQSKVAEKTRPIKRPTFRFHTIDGRSADSDIEHLWLASTSVSRHKAEEHLAMDPQVAKALRRRITMAGKGKVPLTIHELPQSFGLPLQELRKLLKDLPGPTYQPSEVSARALRFLDEQNKKDTQGLMLVTTAQIVSSLHLGWALPIGGPIEGPELRDFSGTKTGRDWVKENATAIEPKLLRSSRKNRISFIRAVAAEVGTLLPSGETIFKVSRQQSGCLLELARSLGFFAYQTPEGVAVVTDEKLLPVPEEMLISRPPSYVLIESVESLGETLGCCIKVEDESHTYMTEDFLPTHNTVTINEILFHQIASGAEIVIIDTPDKSVDFMWAKDYVRPGGWGCESLRASVTAIALAYEEGKRRAELIREAGVVKWLDLPPHLQFRPITIFIDEYSALTVTDPVPKGIPKDHPLRVEIEETNLYKTQLASYVNKVVAEQRSHGNRLLDATQVTNNATGVPPSLKMKIGNKILQGTRPSPQARAQIFSDSSQAPTVPDNIASNPKASKGVGVAEMEGYGYTVYKSYYRDVSELSASLKALGIPKTKNPEPSASDINRICPTDLFDDDDWTESNLSQGGGFGSDGNVDDKKLRGAAAAAHELLLAEQRQENGRN